MWVVGVSERFGRFGIRKCVVLFVVSDWIVLVIFWVVMLIVVGIVVVLLLVWVRIVFDMLLVLIYSI